MDLRKFRDLMASEELYFRRADLFTDKSEGFPPEQYAMRFSGWTLTTLTTGSASIIISARSRRIVKSFM
jgi:hypothetical protein